MARRPVTVVSIGVLLATASPPMQAPVAARATASRPTVPATANGFDQWADANIKEWNDPGMAVGAIKNGKVVLLKGYGVRNLEEKQPVTPQTLLAIGSYTKSFTVVLLGQLVDDGKLDWDKPVIEYLPDFVECVSARLRGVHPRGEAVSADSERRPAAGILGFDGRVVYDGGRTEHRTARRYRGERAIEAEPGSRGVQSP